MRNSNSKKSSNSRLLFEYGYLILAIVSIISLSFTFGVAISELYFTTKIMAFALIIVSYFLVATILHILQKVRLNELKELVEKNTSENIFNPEIDEKLLVLEEAGKFFGVSLKTVDMFRLVASRVGEIIPYTTCAFFVIDEKNNFRVPFATGLHSRLLESVSIGCSEGVAGKAFISNEVERDKNLVLDRKNIEREFLKDLNSAMAIPMQRGEDVFCVLVLYSEKKNNYKEHDEVLAEAIGERITPLIIGSESFEKSLSNALTDSLTNLPNERAFYLVLENQVAEAQRFLEQRSLTVLAIDIKDFAEINEKYGHSTGDKILAYAADIIKGQLRKMDLLCRTVNDEFLAVLPTASDMITDRIVERIQTAFTNDAYPISKNESFTVELSFGSATFLDDGETAKELLKTALTRKHHSKMGEDSSVVFFPKQYIN